MFENGNVVGNAQHFFEFMADKDNGLTFSDHLPHALKEIFGLMRSEDGCWFVKDEQVTFTKEEFEDFDLLFFSHGEVTDLGIQVKRDAVGFGEFIHLCPHLAQFQPETLCLAKDDVFQHAHGLHQLKVLINHTDAALDGLFR